MFCNDATPDTATAQCAVTDVDAVRGAPAPEADGGPNLPRAIRARNILNPSQHTTQNAPEQSDTASHSTLRVKHPVADPRQRQAWRRYFKKLRDAQSG